MNPVSKLTRRLFAAGIAVLATGAPLPAAGAGEVPVLTEPVEAQLAAAPFVPPPTGRRAPASVHVRLEARETTREIAPGVTYPCWTFNGNVPGPMIRVFEGDTVVVDFANHPDNQRSYQVAFHAATGPMDDTVSADTAPGKVSRFSFEASHPGLYLYQAGGSLKAEAVANGMYGLMLVEPSYGFRQADREYSLVQGEFYTSGARDEKGPQSFSPEKAMDERPDHVVFNGTREALYGEGALLANVGERVRLYVGNAGPNLTAAFHLEGKVMDFLYYEGGTALNTDVPTTRIPPGGTVIVELDLTVPGEYEIVDQALFRSTYKGASGLLRVRGEELAGRVGIRALGVGDYTPPPDPVATGGETTAMTPALEEKIAAGKEVFGRTCIACHQANGQGLPFVYPPLAESDYLIADLDRAILGIIKGQSGEMIVKGKKYNMLMPPQMLGDEEIAQVLTFVLNSFGNPGGEIDVERVAGVRAAAP